MTKNIIIIGAGVSGLATAALLAKNGYKITLLEKNAFIGGRASIYQEKGFTFDKGPSWYMMPEIFEQYFKLFNKTPQDFYELKRLDPHYKVFFDNHEPIEIADDIENNIKTFESIEKNAGKKLKEYLTISKYIYEQAMNELVLLDYESPKQLLKKNIIKNIFRLHLFTNLHTLVKKHIKNERLQKILEFTTVFLGGSPFNTPAFYSLVAHTDFNSGIFYPLGGMYQIITALKKLCDQHGVQIQTNQNVTQIKTKNKQAYEIITEEKSYKTDIVISALDYHYVETQLLQKKDQTYPKQWWEKKTLSPSALIIYAGISKKMKNARHHNLYFHSEWESHFQEVFKEKKWPQKPSYYIHIPSQTDPSIAPSGKDTLMFLVPIAPDLNDTDETRKKCANDILTHFEKITNEKIKEYIEVKKIYTHKDFIREYNAYKGTAFGLAHTLLQTALFRPRNKSKKVKNLYYVGQYTNPGIGVPTCLLSAQIVTNRIIEDYANHPL